MAARKVRYEGHVQGVGFRWTVRQLASGYEVCGEVENLPDGSVELRVVGETGEIEGLLNAIRQSHLSGHIRRETASVWEDAPPNLRGFRIL
ncbi:MAG: acylphosphatase [Chthoniobacterales bacterium]|nr:acylphosphatase [Chthoniobacterales bacterium]MCX7712754.1 acylphosphatase [Chthoniobacterales bacterium]